MGKSLMAAAAATGVAATAAPTTFLASSSSSTSEINNDSPSPTPIPPIKKFQKPSWKTKLIPELASAGNIGGEYTDVKCLKEHYKTINLSGGSISSPQANEVNNFNANSQSCLIVEYYKKTYEEGKWWGEFRLIWSLKDETTKQGLMAVVNAKTDNKKLSGSTAAYYLKKNDDGSTWNVSYSKENDEIIVTETNDISKLIPTKGTAIKDLEANWGFVSDLSKICGEDDCSESTDENSEPKSISLEFTAKTGVTSKVEFWNTTPKNWLENVFGTNVFSEKITSVTGTWTQNNQQEN